MRAPQIAGAALAINALVGLALELGEPASETVIAAGIAGYVLLDVIALAALAAYRRDDRELSVYGLGIWSIGILASVYNSIWVIQLLLGSAPSYMAGPAWYHIEVIARALGQLLIVISVATVPRGRLPIAGMVWFIITVLAVYFHVRLVGLDDMNPDETLRIAREVTYSASLLALAFIVVEADRARRDRGPPAARVVS